MRARRIAFFSGLALAVSAGTLSLASADPPLRRIDVSRAFPDAAPQPHDDMVVTRSPADPPAMIERAQWIFDLRFHDAEPYLLGVHRIDLTAPQATPRVMGRFALELFEGPTLIERVRFDFPLLGAADTDASISLEKHLSTRIGVVFPATRRGTRLELWDRATDRRWALPWPPSDTRRNDGGPG